MSSVSPSFERTVSPSYAPRSPSPTFRERDSPSFNRAQSPEYITSKKLNDRRYLSPSPNIPKKTEYDTSYSNKLSSLRVSDNRSPVFNERASPSPDVGYSSRYERKTESQSRSFTNNYETDGVDTSPIVKVSPAGDRAALRRDSWDAIAKTRNLLSHRSLESVANLTESQLNSEMQKKRAEEHSSFVNHEQSYRTQNYSQKYSNEGYVSNEKTYGTTGYKNGIKSGGAASVKVQPVPDGVLGQPVEFESKFIFLLNIISTCICITHVQVNPY